MKLIYADNDSDGLREMRDFSSYTEHELARLGRKNELVAA